MNTLDLALVGNGTTGALIDAHGTVVWCAAPRFDSDPVFCSLLEPASGVDTGLFAIELVDLASCEQYYLPNTPILVTRLVDQHGGIVELTDVMPRFVQLGRVFCPMVLVRQLRRLAGSPRVRIRLRPRSDYGREPASTTAGSHHVRYVCGDLVLRLTTDASITAVLEERPFFVDDRLTLVLGPDETLSGAVDDIARRFIEETTSYWRDWVRSLSIPFEWQDEVIRAAITLKLNTFEDTGAIVAAVTTSIPEAAATARTWDYRYCWLRDGYFVVDALNQLGATRTMERYLGFVLNVIADSGRGALQPVYAVNGGAALVEREIPSLSGYRGMGPVRVGNDAYRQTQHDVYGSAILAAAHVFFDRRLNRGDDTGVFRRLESLGERAAELFDQPDAGIWEFRGRASVHTFSSAMCWAGCDRLARIAVRLGLPDRAARWRARADRIHSYVTANAWDNRLGSFVSTMSAPVWDPAVPARLDASLLRLYDIGFLAANDPRFAGTVDAVGRHLARHGYIYRYVDADDFGAPDNAFLVCTFWYIEALAAIGRVAEARALFERLLTLRNRHGLLAEHVDPRSGEPWGNFVQTYSMVGIIRCALRLSVPWDEAI